MQKIFRNKINIGISFRIALLLFSVSLIFSSCFTYNDIEFKSVNSTEVRKLKLEKTVLVMNVKLNNPNRYKIKVIKADLDLFVGGTAAGKALLTEKVILKKKSEDDYDVIVEINPKDLTKALLSNALGIAFQKKVQVKVKGKVKGRVFIFGKNIDVEFKENIDVGSLKLN